MKGFRNIKKKVLVAVDTKILLQFSFRRNVDTYHEFVLHVNPRKQNIQIKYHLNKLKDSGIEINDTRDRFLLILLKLENEIDTARIRRISV
jgi:hypothetical protein